MRIIIIGNGIAGTTAARYIRKYSEHEIIMISGESEYPFSRTALMYVYMGHQRLGDIKLYENNFWIKNKIQLLKKWVISIDSVQKSILLDDQKILNYDRLIIATGSLSNHYGWKGHELKGVQGLYHLQDLENMESASRGLKRAVIVGGGLIGIEMAEMFHSRKIPVTFLVRENSFWNLVFPPQESAMISRHILEHGIDLRLGTELMEIHDDGEGAVAYITTQKGEKIDCGFVGLTVGVSPNINFIKNSNLEIDRGVLVDSYLKTSAPDIYAIGDCAEMAYPSPGRKSIEAVWYTGRIMGQVVANNICNHPIPYHPGLWFNSAKFLDIEYQVYGDIPHTHHAHIESLYWEHPNGKKSIRINYYSKLHTAHHLAVTGFNLMGIRYRQEVCEKWITNFASIEEVLQNLSLANFDPEFFEEYEINLIHQYNQLHGKALHSKSSRKLNLVNRFLNKVIH